MLKQKESNLAAANIENISIWRGGGPSMAMSLYKYMYVKRPIMRRETLRKRGKYWYRNRESGNADEIRHERWKCAQNIMRRKWARYEMAIEINKSQNMTKTEGKSRKFFEKMYRARPEARAWIHLRAEGRALPRKWREVHQRQFLAKPSTLGNCINVYIDKFMCCMYENSIETSVIRHIFDREQIYVRKHLERKAKCAALKIRVAAASTGAERNLPRGKQSSGRSEAAPSSKRMKSAKAAHLTGKSSMKKSYQPMKMKMTNRNIDKQFA